MTSLRRYMSSILRHWGGKVLRLKHRWYLHPGPTNSITNESFCNYHFTSIVPAIALLLGILSDGVSDFQPLLYMALADTGST